MRQCAGPRWVKIQSALTKQAHTILAKVESGERRLDVVEFIYVARALGVDPKELFAKLLD
jgi:hypothetical protein